MRAGYRAVRKVRVGYAAKSLDRDPSHGISLRTSGITVMPKSTKLAALAIIVLALTAASIGTSAARTQIDFSLAGEWLVTSKPINGQMTSPKGLTLGFPDRDMVFEEQGDLRIGVVLREEGLTIRPLGVWRVTGDEFSTTFQLWCPDANGPCGSIVMRGHFVREDKIKGTMTAFFDVADDRTPTGYDTWTFSFAGNRIAGGSN